MRTPHPQILTCGMRVCVYAYNLPLNLNMCAPYRRSGAASSRPMLPRGASSVLVGLRAAGSRQRARGGHCISLRHLAEAGGNGGGGRHVSAWHCAQRQLQRRRRQRRRPTWPLRRLLWLRRRLPEA